MKKALTPRSSVERLSTWIGSATSLTVHTVLFAGSFLVAALGFADWDTVLLTVTTIVSLEAIYLAIFIQMSVNRAQASLSKVEAGVAEIEENIEEISEDIEGIEKDVAEIEENIDDISEDIEGIEKDVHEIEGNIEEISEDIGEIEKDVASIEEDFEEVSEDLVELQGDVEELTEEETKDGVRKKKQEVTLTEITATLQKLIADIEQLKSR